MAAKKRHNPAFSTPRHVTSDLALETKKVHPSRGERGMRASDRTQDKVFVLKILPANH
jgi:hypothetical protein